MSMNIKNLRFAVLALLAAGTMTAQAQERGVSFSPNYKGYFYLRLQAANDSRALEGNDANSKIMNGAAFMSDQKAALGTMWQLVPAKEQPGWYRLKNKHLGAGKCLEGNAKESTVKGGAAFMDDCKDVTGQAWRLDLVSAKDGNHFYRLRSKQHGDNAALEGNGPDGTAKSGNSFMDTTQNVTGQMWRLNPVK